MSDDRREYQDLLLDPLTAHYRAGYTNVHIHDALTLFQRINASTTPLTLDERTYEDEVTTTKLTARAVTDINSRKKWIYEGRAEYATDDELVDHDFFENLLELGEESNSFDLEPLWFGNVRLMAFRGIGAQALISVHDGHIAYANQARIPSESNEQLAVVLDAKDTIQLKHGPETHLLPYLRGHIFAVNALARTLTGSDVVSDMIISANGTKYLRESSAHYSVPRTLPSRELVHIKQPIIPESEQVVEKKEPLLDSLSGLESVKKELRQVALSFTHPEIMAKWGTTRPQGILLYGPAGTGKTSLAHALANEIDGELWEIKATDIFGPYIGESEKKIEKLFKQAQEKTGPTVLVMDEFEALSDAGNARVTSAVQGVFKREMPKLRVTNPNVIVFATTNHMELLDEALIRAGRFDVKQYVELPNNAARKQIFVLTLADTISTLQTAEFNPYDDTINIPALVAASDELSGADIKEILRRAQFERAMEEAQQKTVTPISQNDLLRIIKDIKRNKTQ